MTTRNQNTAADRPGRPEQTGDRQPRGANRNGRKRIVGGVLGASLLAYGLKRGSRRGWATAILGGGVLVGTLVGGTRIRRALGSGESEDRSEGDRSGVAGTTVSRTVTVGKLPGELFELWRDPEQFARIVGHVAEITESGDEWLRWTVDGPRGRDLSWKTHVVTDEPGEELRWETVGDPPVSVDGAVRFRPAPGDRGTVVTLEITLDAPGGRLGHTVLERLGIVPEALAGQALSRFKALAETGEIPTLSGNPSGRGTGDLL